MPKFRFSKPRIFLPVLLSLFLAIMMAGPGTLILLAAAPSSVNLLGKVVCPTASRMEARWVRYSYSRPGESSLEVACVGEEAGQASDSRPQWFLKLLGFYFVLFLIPLLYLFATAGTKATKVAAAPAKQPPTPLTPAAELEARRLLAEGKKIEAIRLVRELTGKDLKAASHDVEALAARAEHEAVAARPLLERLKEAKEMLDAGLITEREYEAKKEKLLSEL